MNKKIHTIIALGISMNLLPAQELPEGALFPENREVEISEDIRNPFLVMDQANGLTSGMADEYEKMGISLRKQIRGYVASTEPTKSYLTTTSSEIIRIGDVWRINQRSSSEAIQNFILVAIDANLVTFEHEGHMFSIDMDSRLHNLNSLKSGTAYELENVMAQGLIVHPDGWVISNNSGMTKEHDLYVYINDIGYPTKIVSTFPEIGVSLFKIYKEHKEISLPFIKFSDEEPKEGDTLNVQSQFGQPLPYMKQVAMINEKSSMMGSPHVEQSKGAATLNECGELVGFYSDQYVDYRSIALILNELPAYQHVSNEYKGIDKAAVSIVTK